MILFKDIKIKQTFICGDGIYIKISDTIAERSDGIEVVFLFDTECEL